MFSIDSTFNKIHVNDITNQFRDKKLKVMLVVDSETDRLLLERIFKSRNYEIFSFSDPKKALKAYENEYFPFVILDWMMPEIDGIDLCKSMREIPHSQNSVILMLSGRSEEKYLTKALDAGFDDYISKSSDSQTNLLRVMIAEKLLYKNIEKDKLKIAFERNASKYKLIFDNMQDVYFQTDLDGKIIEISPSIFRYSGYKREELIGGNVQKFYYDKSVKAGLIREILEKQEVTDFEIPMRHKNNSLVYTSMNAHVLKNGSLELVGIEGSLRDITHRKRVEIQLRESKQEMVKMSFDLENRVKELSCLHNISEAIESINSKDELFTRITDLIATGMQFPKKIWVNIKIDGKDYSSFEKDKRGFTIISSDIGIFSAIRGVLEVSYFDDSPILDEEIDLLHNVARRIGLLVEKDELILNEKSVALGKLAAGMAHEINNPASAIQSDFDLLGQYAEKLPSSKIKEKITKIIERDSIAISRVTDIVTAVKSVNRPEQWHSIDIHREIELQLTLLQKEVKNRIKIIKKFGKVSGINVHSGDIGQVILNLLSNGIDSIEGKGEIIIKTREEDEFLYVDIKDTGSGIPEDVLPFIAQPFFTTKEVGKGTGLGLYTSMLIAERHGGELFISESKVGEGTTFTLKISRKAHKNDRQ